MRYRSATTSKTVIFLHIPKTAGTTLDQIIFRHYRRKQIYGTGLVSQNGVAAFKEMTDERRARYRLLKGHMNFGIHRYVPGPYAYFTFLREPIDRTVSHFYFIRNSVNYALYDVIQENDMDIKQYLDEKMDPMLFNAHTRLLSGVWDTIPAGTCTEFHLEKAKQNLKNHIEVIGLTERFDESLLLLGKAFGWNHLHYQRKNVTRKRPKKDNLPPEFLKAVQEANELDLALYEYGKTLFEEQLHQFGPTIVDELKELKFKNRLVSPMMAVYWEMRKYSVRVFIRKQIARLSK